MENEEKREETASPKKSGGTIIVIIVIVVILAVGGFVYVHHAKQNTETAMAPAKKTSAPPAIAQATSAPMTKALYKDGTYSAEGDYITHIGQKHIKVTVTLKNDIITSADVVNEADDPMSQHFQNSFISGYKPLVIGKDITKVHLTKVALSSLTPGGFNNALQKIEQEAKS
jgi:uncharacterized protein with FMN-binding domain